MSLTILNQEEINLVTGAGTLVGDGLIQTGNALNDFLNIPFISSFGHAFSVAGLGVPHGIVDLSGWTASQALIGAGKVLGGDVATSQTHWNHDYNKGDYNVIPKWITNALGR